MYLRRNLDSRPTHDKFFRENVTIMYVGKIYTPICSFFQKRVGYIMIADLRPVSNESPGNSIFYKGIHEFLNPSIFVKITVF